MNIDIFFFTYSGFFMQPLLKMHNKYSGHKHGMVWKDLNLTATITDRFKPNSNGVKFKYYLYYTFTPLFI